MFKKNYIISFLKALSLFVSGYIAIFSLAYVRYEFSQYLIDNKVNNLFLLSEGANYKIALERIPFIQSLKVPYYPVLEEPQTIIKSLHTDYDNQSKEAYRETRFLVASKKGNFLI